jgi:hypothetical protein
MTGRFCNSCGEPMHGNRKYDCRDCRERRVEWDALTPAERRAEAEAIERGVR